MFEFEKKLLLTEEEYLCLKESTTAQPLLQINHYFDTPDLTMYLHGVTYRIREKGGKFVATIKEHRHGGYSVENSKEVKNQWDTSHFGCRFLAYVGTLTTERTVLFKDEYCEIVLDKNDYFGKTDYELEIEYRSDKKERANELLATIIEHICKHFPESTPESILGRCDQGNSKSHRFFERYLEGRCRPV